MSDEKSLTVASVALDLPLKQSKALEGLKLRMSHGKAAKYAGVNRKTLRRWMLTDPRFIAAYNDIKALAFLEVEATLVGGAPAAARRLARSARTDDKAAALLLKTVRDIESKSSPLTNADEVAEEKMLAEQKRHVSREMKKHKLLDQNLEVMYETSRRKEAMEEAQINLEIDAMLALPKPSESKALPPAPETLALPEPSTEPVTAASAPQLTELMDPTPPEPVATESPAADADQDEDSEDDQTIYR